MANRTVPLIPVCGMVQTQDFKKPFRPIYILGEGCQGLWGCIPCLSPCFYNFAHINSYFGCCDGDNLTEVCCPFEFDQRPCKRRSLALFGKGIVFSDISMGRSIFHAQTKLLDSPPLIISKGLKTCHSQSLARPPCQSRPGVSMLSLLLHTLYRYQSSTAAALSVHCNCQT